MSAPRATLSGVTSRWQKHFSDFFDNWVRRRAPAAPPLTLAYRQIFILPTRFGWLLGLLMLGMLLGSLNFNNNLGLLTTFIVVSVAHSSLLIAFRNLRGLNITSVSAASVFAGQSARVRVGLRNDENRVRPGLTLFSSDDSDDIDIEPQASAEAIINIETQRRGWMTLPRIGVQTTHPTGLCRAWSWFWADQKLLVWPKPADTPPALPSGHGSSGSREFDQRQDGDSFYSLREWRQGDSLHRVAWKSSQRHDTLLSREYRNEESDQLVLNLESAPGEDNEARISVLTAWVLQARDQGSSWILEAGGKRLGPDAGVEFERRCLDQLAQL